MRYVIASALIAGLAACSGGSKTATFSCPNGPEIAVTYADDTATVTFFGGRTETLPRFEPGKETYAKPGMVWSETGFRTGRLTDGTSSYSCDQTSV
ncbi:MAG: hypothetical protein HKN27_11225 [Silicimonas sp.]|nr:hypothetical protein [Silicimonas sp.]